jgi:hypothetical protein
MGTRRGHVRSSVTGRFNQSSAPSREHEKARHHQASGFLPLSLNLDSRPIHLGQIGPVYSPAFTAPPRKEKPRRGRGKRWSMSNDGEGLEGLAAVAQNDTGGGVNQDFAAIPLGRQETASELRR